MTFSPIISEDYADIIYRYTDLPETFLREYAMYTPQIVDTRYSILHLPLSQNLSVVNQIGYASVPKLFTYIDTSPIDSAGISSVQNQPALNLRGKDVLLGFLDSGIDFTHPAFRNSDGSTRILGIWDQVNPAGPAPFDLGFGSEYTSADINRALQQADPRETVPISDPVGHGTAVAGIACGTTELTEGFSSPAPDSNLLFVRLKPAKQYLRNYFLIPPSTDAFEETDLMLGIRYLIQKARALQRPLVICISLGTNQGGHTGATPLEEVLSAAQFLSGIYVVTGTGNETGHGHHFVSAAPSTNTISDVELIVDSPTDGFCVEFWAETPQLYSIGFVSPLGESIQPVQPRNLDSRRFRFLLESSLVELTYVLVEMFSGSYMALIRFTDPAPGLWRIRVQNSSAASGFFHLWLPISGFVNKDIRFYSSNPDTTLVIPSCAENVITTGTFDSYTSRLFPNSGRGYTRNQQIKPDFVSPGVSLTAPVPGGSYENISGSCAASAFAAGATALLVEAGLRSTPARYFSTQEIKSLFYRGTTRSGSLPVPNPELGYGIMNLSQIFESFLRS